MHSVLVRTPRIRKPGTVIRIAALLAAFAFPLQAGAQIADAFNRADGDDLGNGWIEKQPGAFAIEGNAAAKQGVGTGYRDNVVYRPASDDLLDVEASLEFTLSSLSPGYPQVFTRLQSATVAAANVLDGYILYINNSLGQAILGRQNGSAFVTPLSTITLAPQLGTVDTYRLRLRTIGTDPVTVNAWVERDSGSGWVALGQAQVSDSAQNRIASAGSVGFGGYVESTYVFDNFFAEDLAGAGNPQPTLAGIQPTTAVEGGSAFSLQVTGTNFLPDSIVRWNGADRATTYVSSTELQAAIDAGDIAAAGSASVTVFNPAPGGGTSAAQTFVIESSVTEPPAPTLTAINPSSATEGGNSFVLSVFGSDFVSDSVVRWNGSDRTTGFVSTTELQATITAADIATAGNASVTVFTPTPGGGLSAAQTFTIDPAQPDNPVPTLVSIDPTTAVEGSGAFTLTATGSNFVPDSVIRWNGSDRATTFISANELQAAIPASDIASQGNFDVSVSNPAPGGGSSAPQSFVVTGAGGGGGNGNTPILLDIYPQRLVADASDQTVTIVGSDFDNDAVVLLDNQPITTTFLSSSELTADVGGAFTAESTVLSLTVQNPTPNPSLSEPHPIFVLENDESYFFDNFNAPDNPDIGNNWTEKTPFVFDILNSQVAGIATSASTVYRDSIVYRPQTEDRRDVEVSTEFVRRSSLGMAQVHARVQRDVVEEVDNLESYILYVFDFVDPPSFALAIGPDAAGVDECNLNVTEFPSALLIGERYRLTLRVTGDAPVQLEGEIEWFTGGNWQPFAYMTAEHDVDTQPNPSYYCGPGYMPPPIQTSGAVGFSKWSSQSDLYDNFYWRDVGDGGSGGVSPLINAVTPDTVDAGSGDTNIVVDGSGFFPDSVVRWNGTALPSTFISGTSLQATVGSSLLTTPQTAQITVFSPNPDIGESGAVPFYVVPAGGAPVPDPELLALLPTSATSGSADTQIEVTGSGFVSSSQVFWNDSALGTTVVSDTNLIATIPTALLQQPGSAAVRVRSVRSDGTLASSDTESFAILEAGEYFDDFNRSDSSTVGSGWQEKNSLAFSISNRRLAKNNVVTGYRDNVVYRSADGEFDNVEVSAEFRYAANPSGYPQILTRLQSASLNTSNSLDGYILYVNGGGTSAVIGRQSGTAFVQTLGNITLSETLVPQETYRMQLSTEGTNSVIVMGTIQRLGPFGWIVIGQASAQDSSPQRISGPGTVGLGGYVETGYSFDNFRRRSID